MGSPETPGREWKKRVTQTEEKNAEKGGVLLSSCMPPQRAGRKGKKKHERVLSKAREKALTIETSPRTGRQMKRTLTSVKETGVRISPSHHSAVGAELTIGLRGERR